MSIDKKWKIQLKDLNVRKQYFEALKKGLIDEEDNRIIKLWYDVIQMYGPESLLVEKRWDDHPLDGEWRGYRSSCFSPAGRIIYKIEDNILTVVVFKITPDHNYKKGD